MSSAKRLLHRANEQLAQIGVRIVNSGEILIQDPPPLDPQNPGGARVDLTNGLDGFDLGVEPIEPTIEEKAILRNFRTAATDDVELYFVSSFNDFRWGEAFNYALFPDAKYADSIIVTGNMAQPFVVIAHEIGHLLLDTGDHYTGTLHEVNLMRGGVSTTDSVTATKRLNLDQEILMLSNRPSLLS